MKIKEVNISDTSLNQDLPIVLTNVTTTNEKFYRNKSFGIKERLEGMKPNYFFGSGLNFITNNTKLKAAAFADRMRNISSTSKYTMLISFILVIIAIGTTYSFYYSFIQKQTAPSNLLKFDSEILAAKILPQKMNLQINDRIIRNTVEPKSFENPINGTLYTKNEIDILNENHPVAVVIDNQTAARPQTGISQADLVYESVVEGGITRLLGVYWANPINTVGPVRSARNQYIEWISPFDSLFIHDGCASSTDSRIDACGNITSFKIKDIGTLGSWRDSSNGQVAPHDEYNSILRAIDFGKSKEWNGKPAITSWKFKNDALLGDRANKTTVKLQFSTGFGSSDYAVKWVYNRSNNIYMREIAGVADFDTFTSKQISAKVVIIEENNVINSNDSQGHVIIDTTGSGNAKILQDGKIIPATWKKEARSTRTTYSDKDSKEIIFNRGLIWIESLPRSDGQFTIEEQ